MKNHKSFATISDVANYAKVGKTSVSRYLNGEQDKLSDALRDKIADAIEHLDFRPNHSARMLKAGHSKLIGLLLADVTNPYSIDILQGAEHICRQQGYMLMVCNTDNETALQEGYLALLEAHRVDGLIVNTADMAHTKLHHLKQINCPLVLVDRIDTSLGFDSVGLDNEAAIEDACQHLKARHYQSILVVTESLDVAPRKARINAIDTFCQQHSGIAYELVEVRKNNDAHLNAAIGDFMNRHKGCKQAIFTTNGVATLLAAKAIKNLQLKLGHQIGMISIDDPEWVQLFEGGITVMRQPTREIGQQACSRLLTRIQGNTESAQHIQLPAELIIRQST
ncbi:LacI family DNA-binding transcriptional regulator [Marinomonas arenicola]|uniref:LacI family DNA-binding transcriptional regulator n=1 Tax=Marinomonas arenicola TaxID=569601 RepID=UPI00311EEF65